jgi:hypothetical protein
MIISFGWTAQYLPPNGIKDTTRRIWKPRTLASWQKAWDEGRLEHQAVDKCLAYGGKRIGVIKLVERPYLAALWDMTEPELIREGGMVDTVEEFIAKYFGGDKEWAVAVVRFEFTPAAKLISEAPL